MRVAAMNRLREAMPGGDLVHIDNLSASLRKLGVNRPYTPSETLTDDYDLYHIHHVNFTWCRMNFDAVRKFPHVPYIITTIFYPSRQWEVKFEEMRKWMEGAAMVVTYSGEEQLQINHCTGFKGPMRAIPPGVGEEFHRIIDPNREGYVLAVTARGGGSKNPRKTLNACTQLNIPFHHASGVKREDLPAVYAGARVFVNASEHESFGLVNLEALASGCRCVISKYCWCTEYFPGLVTVDPMNPSEMLEAVDRAYHSVEWDWRPNLIAQQMTWDLEAQRMKQLYEEVLGGRRGGY